MSSIRDFVPLAKLGEGAFSTVYKVKRLSDQQVYALKKVRMKNLSHREKENALNEIRILASLSSHSIIGYKEAFFDEKLNLLCIVMEYADQGDLQKYIASMKKRNRPIPEKVIWRMIADVLMALHHLHQKNILHRDLKSANIFINSIKSSRSSDATTEINSNTTEIYKLGDLNVSKVNHGSLAYTQTGTPYYASPEVWRDQPYDSKSDIWSFGCILYEMACFSPPFQGNDMEQLFRNIQKKNHKPIPDHYSYQLSDLIDNCLLKEARKRPSAGELLNHIIVSQFVQIRTRSLELSDPTQIERQFQSLKSPYSKIHSSKNQLLETIKLPTDLKTLQKKLPTSKYGAHNSFQNISNLGQPKPKRHGIDLYKSDRPGNHLSEANNKQAHGDEATESVEKSTRPKVEKPAENITKALYSPKNENKKIYNSEVFLSPPNKIEKNISYAYRSPQEDSKKDHEQKLRQLLYSERRITPKSYSIDAQDSQKVKSSKKPIEALGNKYQKFMRDEVLKKQFSMPRTEKVSLSSHKQRNKAIHENSSLHHINKKAEEQRVGEDWKKKLVKKSRVYSNNNHMKHYYAYPY